MSAPTMQIGGVSKQAMDVAADSICKVIAASGDPMVIIEALKTLAEIGATSSVTVSNCTINANPATPTVRGSDWSPGTSDAFGLGNIQ